MIITDDYLAGLTEEQKAAVEFHPKGRLRISAGAGSGKTEVLTRRIVSMLKAGVKPDELVAITYTQKAAAEMKNRLIEKRKISPAILREMEVSTFHAFISNFIKQDPFGAGIDRSDSVIEESNRQLILAELKEKFAELHGEEIINGPEKLGAVAASRLINEFPEALGKIRRFLLKPAEFYNLSRERFKARTTPPTALEKNTLEWIFRFSTYFIEELQKRSLLDFDEILIRGRNLVREMVEHHEHPSPRVFLIDEFQDNNPDQLGIVNLFCSRPDSHITVVGDEKQSIYRFQGADISTFRNFNSDTDIILKDNFRSYAEIIELADKFLSLGSDQGKLTVPQNARRNASPRTPAIVTLAAPDEQTEEETCSQLTDFIQNIVSSGMAIKDRKTGEMRKVRYGDIAIILGSIKSLPAEFEDSLAARNIPYVMSGGFSFYARSEIEEIMSFLKLLVQPTDDYSVAKILTGPLYGLKDSELAQLAQAGRSEKTALLPHILAMNESELPQKAVEFRRLYVYLKNRGGKPGLIELCHTIIEQAGFMEYAATQESDLKRRRMENNLNKFLNIVRHFEQNGIFTSLRDFLNYIEKILTSGIDEDEAGLGLEEGDAIKILTIHKSKGLEFPIVFCPFLKARSYRVDDKIFFDREYGLMVIDPEKGKKDYSPNLEKYLEADREASFKEDRRKLYVAFTRAEELLILSGLASKSLLEKELKNNKPQEPFAEVCSILEQFPKLGRNLFIDQWPEIIDCWKQAGTITESDSSESSEGHQSCNLAELESQLDSLKNFLSQNVALCKEVTVKEEIFSLQDLNLFKSCPRKYFFTSRHVKSFNEKEKSFSGTTGTIFHETVRIFHERNGHKLPGIAQKIRLSDVIITDLCELYEDCDHAIRAKVHHLFRKYIESELSSREPWQIEAEVNIKFPGVSGPFFLRGFADRVDKDGSEIMIIDFKTRKFSEEVHKSYTDQLALYMIAASRGVLGETNCLSFAKSFIAYVDEPELKLVELCPDLLAFEKDVTETVEKIRQETNWLPNKANDCNCCGFAVFCNSIKNQ